MFCPKCGSKISDDARFCTECGLPLGGLSGKTAAEEGPKAEPSERESSSAEVILEPTDTKTDSAIGSANAESTAEPSPEPVSKTASSGHSQMYNFFMRRCQVGNRLVPQFAIMIAAFIAAAGAHGGAILFAVQEKLARADFAFRSAEFAFEFENIDYLLYGERRGGLLSVAERRIGYPPLVRRLHGNFAVVEHNFRDLVVIENSAIKIRFGGVCELIIVFVPF